MQTRVQCSVRGSSQTVATPAYPAAASICSRHGTFGIHQFEGLPSSTPRNSISGSSPPFVVEADSITSSSPVTVASRSSSDIGLGTL